MFGFGRRPIQKLQFIVAGAQKSGTTALNYYLKRHPRIALPIRKELHFFDNDELFAGGNVSYQPLHEMFRPARAGNIAGENTPIYLYWRPALPRIRNYNPEMKFIVILRNPIERAFSQWNMQRSRGHEPLDFLEAIHAEPRRIAEAAPKQLRKFSYLDRGRYAEQLDRAFRLFPRERFLVLKYETFRARQREIVDEVFCFLNLTPVRFRPVEAHDIPYARKIREHERAAVREILETEIGRLETLLEWDCSDWR
jgi:sulfotransferase family protein